jgi:hypothetical protein
MGLLKQRHRFLFDFQLWNLHDDGLIGFFLLVPSGAELVKKSTLFCERSFF